MSHGNRWQINTSSSETCVFRIQFFLSMSIQTLAYMVTRVLQTEFCFDWQNKRHGQIKLNTRGTAGRPGRQTDRQTCQMTNSSGRLSVAALSRPTDLRSRSTFGTAPRRQIQWHDLSNKLGLFLSRLFMNLARNATAQIRYSYLFYFFYTFLKLLLKSKTHKFFVRLHRSMALN